MIHSGGIVSKNIENTHVLVVGSGPSLKKYEDKIRKFIAENDVVTFGCNHIKDFLVPDYHYWGSIFRWREFGHAVDKRSTLVFSIHFPKRIIRERWKGPFKRYRNTKRYWGPYPYVISRQKKNWCKVKYKNNYLHGCFNIGSTAIFRAYVKHAAKISVVGLDGYTLNTEKDLKNKKQSQHCYGEGLTDGFNYAYCRKKDIDSYRTLMMIYKYCKKKYGFGFEILTPTIFKRFYNPKVLGIEDEYEIKEPSTKEYSKLAKIIKNKKK